MTANKDETKVSIETLLRESRVFKPSPAFCDQAWAKDDSVYEIAARDPESYWAGWAKELDWTQPWKKILEWKAPHAKWFVGGKLNATVNCVDRTFYPPPYFPPNLPPAP